MRDAVADATTTSIALKLPVTATRGSGAAIDISNVTAAVIATPIINTAAAATPSPPPLTPHVLVLLLLLIVLIGTNATGSVLTLHMELFAINTQ